jgi:hypothetical protein
MSDLLLHFLKFATHFNVGRTFFNIGTDATIYITVICIVRAKKNAIKDSYEKGSAVSLIKKFVLHLWNPEMSYLNKQL